MRATNDGAPKMTHRAPESYFEWHDPDSDEGHDRAVGWDLAYGCRVTFGYDEDVLTATVSASNDCGDAICVREADPRDLREFARQLYALSASHDQHTWDLAKVVHDSLATTIPKGYDIPSVIAAVVGAVTAHEESRR